MTLSIALPSAVTFELRTTGHACRSTPIAPDAAGPEGWAAALPSRAVPCHWCTAGSPAEYALRVPGGGGAPDVDRGRGLAHFETNYGAEFPSAWVWAQMTTARRGC